MSLRKVGTIKKWNHERGFGFVTLQSTGEDIFVHISEFTEKKVPNAGDVISFEVVTGNDHRQRAIRVMFSGFDATPVAPRARTAFNPTLSPAPRSDSSSQHAITPCRNNPHTKKPSNNGVWLRFLPAFCILMVASIFWDYEGDIISDITSIFAINTPRKTQHQLRENAPSLANKPQDYVCDGRQHCSQMRSCEEATFFIKNCPNTKMDGDRDGIPCEGQLCSF